LFELGSCHHKQYLVNLLLPSLPLGEALEQFRGLAPLSKLTIYVSSVWSIVSKFYPLQIKGERREATCVRS